MTEEKNTPIIKTPDLEQLAKQYADQEKKERTPPCIIHTEMGAFAVPTIGGYVQLGSGIFASGHWTHTGVPMDVWIPNDRVEYMEFDFEALNEPEEGDGASTSD